MRVGADAGASSRPFTSLAFAGGGGGGWKVAPPPFIDELCAIAPGAAASAQTSASAAKSNLLARVEGILFRTPTGLADGLALKELARLPISGRFAPVAGSHLGSPVPRYRGFGVAIKLSDVSANVAVALMRYHTSSARARRVLLDRAGRPSPRSTRSSDHAIKAIKDSAIASTVRYAASVKKPGTPCFRSRWRTSWSARKPRVKLAFAGTAGAGIAWSAGIKIGIEI